ncbi:SMP-30/gluconolactonase/LRE family protein [Massilia horti]|uniref:SMP-30/gluconolactonase/LRE family protein n=1 Tax=Massilia horti TaxID=2562153 RepID=A0A4Y9T4N8_9BURK|nr:SMP-30/gluconolactonase/LRE family protein [Massilia horti]TFW31930.1 SMP-30/gluconolactonase/LRE family protein [Massilia horti]
MSGQQPECIWPVGAELGEGVLWHAPTRSIYFVDIKGHRLHRCDENGARRHSWNAPGQIGFVVPAHDGGFVCGLEDGLYRFDEASGTFAKLGEVEPDIPGNRLNDGFVDQAGRLWFGTMDNGQAKPTGSLYRFDERGVSRADSGYIITNGPAVSPDGRTLYHVDTLGLQVFAFDLLPDGSVANKRLFTRIARPGHPDGLAVDSAGHVWITVFRGARIERYTPGGQLVGSVTFPVTNITKLAFGGDDLRTAYVTTAWKGLAPDERASQPLAGGLFMFRTDTPGQPQYQFAGGTLP